MSECCLNIEGCSFQDIGELEHSGDGSGPPFR